MQSQQKSMKWKVMRILLLCWLVPFFLFIVVLGVFFGSNHMEMTAVNYQSQQEFNVQICVDRLDQAVADSRQASYDGEILSVRQQYVNGEISDNLARKSYTGYLAARYQKSRLISSVILWLGEGETRQFCGTYSEQGNGTYQQVRHYLNTDHDAVEEYAATLDTSVGFLVRGKTLYLVRNLVDSSYQVQGTLVFHLNNEYCFDSLSSYPMQDGSYVRINDGAPLLCSEKEAEQWKERLERLGSDSYRWMDGQLCVADSASGDSYSLYAAMMVQRDVMMFPIYGYPYVLAGMLASLILMLAAMLRVFRREVTRPVALLIGGLRHIEQGELGYQIAETVDNLEFGYLTDAVNHMSRNLEEQILKSYQEEIALKEARIMALQSHINPHFMNNTLEIINWEARLSGNLKVSKMIEALSVMMDAAMDRRKRPQVKLAEEMGYVNAYLYIMKERLGQRLVVETDLPEELMNCQVPRLILQPLIENAIDHGVVPRGSGTVTIRGYRKEEYLCLETQNDGGLTREDRERIDRLLAPDYITSREPEGNLGIANVNQRLRILFGDPCKLTIEETDGYVIARITIPYSE